MFHFGNRRNWEILVVSKVSITHREMIIIQIPVFTRRNIFLFLIDINTLRKQVRFERVVY